MANTSRGRGFWFLILIALPFVGVGGFAGTRAGASILRWAAARSWEPVPARILTADLEQTHGDDATTYHVVAVYEYTYRGRTYTSDRVAFGSGSDNVGSFQQDKYAELRRYLNAGKPFRCFVDPVHPGEAVLYRELRWGMLGFELLFVLVFGGAGVGMFVAGWYGKRLAAEGERLRQMHPDQPWLWRSDWLDGKIPAGSRRKMIGAWVFAAFWNLVSSPVIFIVPRELGDGNKVVLIALLFPAVGAVLLAWAVRATLQWRTFGSSEFEMLATPGVLGGTLRGRIHTRLPLRQGEGITLTLSCVRRVTTGSGQNRSTHDRVLWQDSYRVPGGSLVAGPRGASVPVHFTIPYEAGPATAPDDDEPVLWRLRAAARLPGVDYVAQFAVPVFRTPDSDPAVQLDTPEFSDAVTTTASPILETAGIIRRPAAGGGVTYIFTRARARGPVLGLTAFTLLWCGLIWLMLALGAPVLFPVVFGLFALLLVLVLAQMWLQETRIHVRAGALMFRRRWLVSGKRLVIAAADIASIQAQRGMQAGSKLYYRIVLRTRSGKQYTLASALADQRLAKRLIQEFETALAS